MVKHLILIENVSTHNVNLLNFNSLYFCFDVETVPDCHIINVKPNRILSSCLKRVDYIKKKPLHCFRMFTKKDMPTKRKMDSS